jgi:hypothetical protein
MSILTLAPATCPEPPERPRVVSDGPLVSYAAYDALQRAILAALAAEAGGHPSPLAYLRDALGGAGPRPGAHPREYVPCDPDDATFGRW